MLFCEICGHRKIDHTLSGHIEDDNLQIVCPRAGIRVPMSEWKVYGRALDCARTATLLGKRLMPYMRSIRVIKTKAGMFQVYARKGDTK